MQKNPPGYPLPSGELGNDDIVCQLVFLPNRPEYWQALVGALGYMATWRAWERDTDKRGKDAASQWRDAFEMTMECWRMACLQELQDNVAEILAIMQLGNSCCDDQDITDGDRYTDRIEDGEGEVPQNIIDAGYASDVDDWAGFDDYKCMIAHVTVNQLEARLREISVKVDDAGPYLAVAAALSAILGVVVATGGLAIIFGILAGIGTVSALYYALIEFGPVADLADEVATNHEQLACAIYFADGDEGALIALNDKIDELFTSIEAVILKNMNLGPTLKSLYAGRYDQQDIAEILEAAGYELGDFDCACDYQIGEFTVDYDFDASMDGWITNLVTRGNLGRGGSDAPHWSSTSAFMKQGVQAVFGEGFGYGPDIGDTVAINKITFWYKCQAGYPTNQIVLELYYDAPGSYWEALDYETDWTFVRREFSPPQTATHILDNVIRFSKIGSSSGVVIIDDVHIDFDAEDV